MATVSAPSATSQNDRNRTTLPPRRGQIKAQIFESMVKAAKAAAAAAAAAFLGIRNSRGDSSNSDDTPPPSTYNSDGNANLP